MNFDNTWEKRIYTGRRQAFRQSKTPRGLPNLRQMHLNVVVVGVEELVDLGEPSLYVPEEDEAQRPRGTQHPVTLVLVDPL